MTDSPESRIIADVSEEEDASHCMMLPDAEEDEIPHQPIADAIADPAQVGRERPASPD